MKSPLKRQATRRLRRVIIGLLLGGLYGLGLGGIAFAAVPTSPWRQCQGTDCGTPTAAYCTITSMTPDVNNPATPMVPASDGTYTLAFTVQNNTTSSAMIGVYLSGLPGALSNGNGYYVDPTGNEVQYTMTNPVGNDYWWGNISQTNWTAGTSQKFFLQFQFTSPPAAGTSGALTIAVAVANQGAKLCNYQNQLSTWRYVSWGGSSGTSVSVTNWPSSQNVAVSNWPSSQHVTVDNAALATNATIVNWPTSQHVTVDNQSTGGTTDGLTNANFHQWLHDYGIKAGALLVTVIVAAVLIWPFRWRGHQ